MLSSRVTVGLERRLRVMRSGSRRSLAVVGATSGGVGGGGSIVVSESLRLADEGALENDATLFVALRFLRCELVDPSQLRLAVFTRDVAHHVPTRKHDPVLDVAEGEIDDFIEEKSPAGGAGESG